MKTIVYLESLGLKKVFNYKQSPSCFLFCVPTVADATWRKPLGIPLEHYNDNRKIINPMTATEIHLRGFVK